MIDHIECLFELLHFISDFIDRMFEILILFQYFTWIWSWLNMAKTLLVALLKCNTFINSTVKSKSVISVLFSIDHIAAQFYLPVKKMFLGGASIFFWEGSHVDLTWARFLVVPLLPAVLREDILNIWKQSPMQIKTFSNVQSIASEKNILKCPTNQPNK